MTPQPFDLFRNQLDPKQSQEKRRLKVWPPPPPWRTFLPETSDQCPNEQLDELRWHRLDQLMETAGARQKRIGEVFRLPVGPEGNKVRIAVNAALRLRRPLLVSGDPGSGKSSLAHAIACELSLGPVLTWAITPRSRLLEDGLYRYDALGRLQDAQLDQLSPRQRGFRRGIGQYVTLGPVGTAFLPSRWPRVLLIDEIDKADLQLPNELLHLFEEGEFVIEELIRDSQNSSVDVRTSDRGLTAIVHSGTIQCHVFPIIVMTSNRERDFPAAFHRRCLRVEMPRPTKETLDPLLEAHFQPSSENDVLSDSVRDLVQSFIGDENRHLDRSVDQLLNRVFFSANGFDSGLTSEEKNVLTDVLYKKLSER